MQDNDPIEALIPPALLADVEAMAAAEHRSAREVLRAAVEQYRNNRLAMSGDKKAALTDSADNVVQRILERRKHHPLPEGMTIRDMQTFGRS